MTDYTTLPDIVDELLAKGVKPSADQVRNRLGSGSRELIQRSIHARIRELAPDPDPAHVEAVLSELRLEGDRRLAMGLLSTALAALRSIEGPVTTVSKELSRRHRQTPAALSAGGFSRPPHHVHVDTLLEPLPKQITAAAALLRAMEGMEQDHSAEGLEAPS